MFKPKLWIVFKYGSFISINQFVLLHHQFMTNIINLSIVVGDRMFLGMQDCDFCPNLIKFYPILI